MIALLAALALAPGLARPASLRFPVYQPEKAPGIQTDDLRVELAGAPVVVRDLTGWAGPIVVWLDAPSIGPRGIETAVRSLADEADRLVELGPVDVVLADPEPAPLVLATRDGAVLREALRQAGQDAVAVGELAWLRQRYLAASEHRTPGAGEAREAAGRETRLLRQQRLHLVRWLADEPRRAPGTLLLVSDGFDLEPRRFYLQLAGEAVPERSPPAPEHTRFARYLAASGWTVVALALGRSQPELQDPLAPLSELTDATAGRVVRRPKEISRALDRLGRRWLVTAEVEDPGAAGPPRPLVVDSTRRGSKITAPRWGSTADVLAALDVERAPADVADPPRRTDRPLISLLPPDPGTLVGVQRIETVTGRRRIGRVLFRLDGEPVHEDTEAPFDVEVDLGTMARAHALEAVAYSRSGRELGADALTLNPELDQFRIEISELLFEPEGQARIRAEVHTPRGRILEGVEVYLDHTRVATLETPPFETTFAVGGAGRAGYVRVVARLDDGSMQEDARLAEPAASSERIDVQLVELLAVVTRRSEAPASLGPEDFTVVQGGEIQPIRQFAAAADLPLNLGLAIDTSDSMQSWLESAREAAARFLSSTLHEGDRAFLIQFDTTPKLAQGPSDLDTVVQRLGGLRPRGDTVLYDGVVFSLLQFDRLEGGRRALVILTDGRDEGSRFGPADCLREATRRGVPIYFLALGGPPDPLRDPRPLGLSRLARRTGGRLFYLSSPDDLDPIYDRIRAELESQYYLAYSTDEDVSEVDLGDLEVSVQGVDLEVRAVAAPRQPGR